MPSFLLYYPPTLAYRRRISRADLSNLPRHCARRTAPPTHHRPLPLRRGAAYPYPKVTVTIQRRAETIESSDRQHGRAQLDTVRKAHAAAQASLRRAGSIFDVIWPPQLDPQQYVRGGRPDFVLGACRLRTWLFEHQPCLLRQLSGQPKESDAALARNRASRHCRGTRWPRVRTKLDKPQPTSTEQARQPACRRAAALRFHCPRGSASAEDPIHRARSMLLHQLCTGLIVAA